MNEAGKVNKASVAARLKIATDKEEIVALKKVKDLIEKEAEYKKPSKTRKTN